MQRIKSIASESISTDRRHSICAVCESAAALTDDMVHCLMHGDAAISLKTGRCRLGKWPSQVNGSYGDHHAPALPAINNTTQTRDATAQSVRRTICHQCDQHRGERQGGSLCLAHPTGIVSFNSNACPLHKWPTVTDHISAATLKHLGLLPAEPSAPTDKPKATTAANPLRFFSDAQQSFMAKRKSVCQPCDHNRGMTVLTVRCKLCGCAGLSLLHGSCRLRKWDNIPDALRESAPADAITLPPADAASPAKTTLKAQPRGTAAQPVSEHPIIVAVRECEGLAREHRPAIQAPSTTQLPLAAHPATRPAIDRIAVIGHPSRVGGADTELDHQIHCWQAMGVEVHVCPTHGMDAHMRSLNLAERGCIYHEPRDWASLAGMHCISFCNGEFLNELETIKRHAKTTTFVNCMTWNFPKEIEGQRRGLIDFHLYQSDHGKEKVGKALSSESAPYRPLRFTPYFHAADFPYIEDRPRETFRFGRISRPDADKFNSRQMWIYETMTAPVMKEGIILGWDSRAERKCGKPPEYVKTYPANGVSQQAFYRFCDAVIMSTDTFENLPRVGLEAMASGSVLVVDDRGGWQQLVEHGVTGWRCKNDREFAYLASRLAFEGEERERMRRAARERLEERWGLGPAMASWANIFGTLAATGGSQLARRRLVVGVFSAKGYQDRRERCRRTWMKDAAGYPADMEVVFLIGDPQLSQPRREGDTVYLPCPDDYASLPQKTRAFVQWALQTFDFEYLFKCDDDTYVCLPRLMQCSLVGQDYVGADIGGYASGGAGYFLSHKAAGILETGLAPYREGAEDVLVGSELARANIDLTSDSRFHGWETKDETPRNCNWNITVHPIRDERMDRIHAGWRDAAATPTLKSSLVDVRAWRCGYGEVGLNGQRGFNVNDSSQVQLPQNAAFWKAYETISAHAPSMLEITVDQDVAVFGCIDQAAWESPLAPLSFKVDGLEIGTVGNHHQRTAEHLLIRGTHRLQVCCSGAITRRYPIWGMRSLGRDEMRIVIPTSNRHARVVPTTVRLLDRYWSDHPPIDVVHHEVRPHGANVDSCFFAGSQLQVSWCEAMRAYLEQANRGELVLILLDDYALCGQVDRTRIEQARQLMAENLSIGAFYLTWMMLPSKTPMDGVPQVTIYPRWTYSVHLQAGIWRRSRLLNLLEQLGRASCEAFELSGSHFHNEQQFTFVKHVGFSLPDPDQLSLFLDDTDKRHWPIPYHNLMHRGQPDDRHLVFLHSEGLTASLAPIP